MPTIAILMGTLNGESFLRKQLDSIERQTFGTWTLWISDDGSTDRTIEVLNEYRIHWGEKKIHLMRGPRNGSAANFLNLISNDGILADFYAFCDQDDVWEADKLERAFGSLKAFDQNALLLYCSRTRVIDENDNTIGLSPLFLKKPSFNNALVQNIGGGNTMVFNNATRHLLAKMDLRAVPVAHDWWTYLVVSGSGGIVFYDQYPTVKYRRHNGNLMGSNLGCKAALSRIVMLINGRYRCWIDQNTKALSMNKAFLDGRCNLVLDKFCSMRASLPLLRPYYIWQMKIYRQSVLGTLGISIASIFGLV